MTKTGNVKFKPTLRLNLCLKWVEYCLNNDFENKLEKWIINCWYPTLSQWIHLKGDFGAQCESLNPKELYLFLFFFSIRIYCTKHKTYNKVWFTGGKVLLDNRRIRLFLWIQMLISRPISDCLLWYYKILYYSYPWFN